MEDMVTLVDGLRFYMSIDVRFAHFNLEREHKFSQGLSLIKLI